MWTQRRYPQGVIVTGPAAELAVRVASPARPARSYLSDGLSLAACGPMFAFDSTGRLRPLGVAVDRAAGVELASTQPSHGATVAVVDGRASVSTGATVPQGATVAVQGYPTLVESGRVQVSGQHDQESTQRVAIGVDTTGQIVIAAAPSMSMLAFAQWLSTTNVRDAVYLDGGSAAELVSADGALAVGSSRALPSVVGFRAGVGGEGGGGGGWGWLIAVALAAAAARRRR